MMKIAEEKKSAVRLQIAKLRTGEREGEKSVVIVVVVVVVCFLVIILIDTVVAVLLQRAQKDQEMIQGASTSHSFPC